MEIDTEELRDKKWRQGCVVVISCGFLEAIYLRSSFVEPSLLFSPLYIQLVAAILLALYRIVCRTQKSSRLLFFIVLHHILFAKKSCLL